MFFCGFEDGCVFGGFGEFVFGGVGALGALCALAVEEESFGEFPAADFVRGCGVDVGDEDLLIFFDGSNGFDVKLFPVEPNGSVVVTAVVDQSSIWMQVQSNAVIHSRSQIERVDIQLNEHVSSKFQELIVTDICKETHTLAA